MKVALLCVLFAVIAAAAAGGHGYATGYAYGVGAYGGRGAWGTGWNRHPATDHAYGYGYGYPAERVADLPYYGGYGHGGFGGFF